MTVEVSSGYNNPALDLEAPSSHSSSALDLKVASGHSNPVPDLEAASSHHRPPPFLELDTSSCYSNPALDMSDEREPATPDSDYDDLFSFSEDELDENLESPGAPHSLDNGDPQGHDEPDVLCIPFGNIHNPPHKFKDPQRRVFIPGTDIDVNIIEYDRSVTTHLLNPNLTNARRPDVFEFLGSYTIELMHGGYTWTIKKRYSHIQTLHQQLKMYRTSLSIPFPTKAHRERRISFRHDTPAGTKKKHKAALPR
uniref:(California timema) hypothetical protein n=1 Tax=Timema californicum TaxID=61474 RepID=A0A7R9P714_TIMCA|nr:unnamed protein product [Timema californicum]